MECKRLSPGKRRRGFTIVEYLIASAIGVMVMGAAMSLWAYSGKTCASLFAYIDLTGTSARALDRVSQQVRNARRIQSCSATQVVLLQLDGRTNVLGYNAGAQTLTSTLEGRTTILLTECTNFQFAIYQRTPMSNSMELYNNGFATNSARVVRMQWTCKRQLTGDQDNLETQVSAKVVIRNP